MSERRHRFRAEVDLPVWWRPYRTQLEWQNATLIDISSSGARLRSEEAPTYHELTIVAPLPDGLPKFILRSELVRIAAQLPSREFAWAVAFRDLDTADQARLARYAFSEARRQLTA